MGGRLIGVRLLVGLFLGVIAVAQGPPSAEELHQRDLEKWSKRSGLSVAVIDQMFSETRDVPHRQDPDSMIENFDISGLRRHHHVLMSTWEPGTGHCLSVFVFSDPKDPKLVWELHDVPDPQYSNLCTASVLGAATARAEQEAVVIRVPGGSMEKRVVRRYVYKWDGTAYSLVHRSSK